MPRFPLLAVVLAFCFVPHLAEAQDVGMTRPSGPSSTADVDWDDVFPGGDPCDDPFSGVLCGYGNFLDPDAVAATAIGEDIIDKAENNWVYGTIFWIAENLGPNVPTGDDEEESTSESTSSSDSAEWVRVGDDVAAAGFGNFIGRFKVGDRLPARRMGLPQGARLTLASVQSFEGEFVVRLTARRGQTERPVWFVSRPGQFAALVLPWAGRD